MHAQATEQSCGAKHAHDCILPPASPKKVARTRGVDFEVVAVSRVQAQQAAARRGRVHHVAEQVAQRLGLLPPRVRQHPAVLQNEQRLHAARLLAAALLGRRRPAQRLQLHLAVDARKLATLLQHRLRQQGRGVCWL
jgi:hypothetical protein